MQPPLKLIIPLAGLVAVAACASSVEQRSLADSEDLDGDCAVRVSNTSDWGVEVRARAPGSGVYSFDRGYGYLERRKKKVIRMPCSYQSVRISAELDEMSGRSDQWNVMGIGFQTGVCLTPSDTANAVLERFGKLEPRWWERCGGSDRVEQ